MEMLLKSWARYPTIPSSVVLLLHLTGKCGLRDYGTANWQGGNERCKHYICGDGGFPGEKQKTNNGSLRIAKDICPKCGAVRIDNQIGLEKTPELYISKMVEVFTEVRRVLRKDGTLWLNLGDSYCNAIHGSRTTKQTIRKGIDGTVVEGRAEQRNHSYLKDKDLCMIPARVAIALQQSGWWLRQDLIWSKPNPMPESVRDRCTKAHEYIFLLTKSGRYYYDADAIKEEAITQDDSLRDRDNSRLNNTPGRSRMAGLKTNNYETRNRRSVWEITTQPYSGAHFATFPEEIPTLCIKAGSKKGDTILDPFAGSGTTGDVALRLDRNFIGIELNKKYIDELIIPRLENINPLFKNEVV